VSITNRTKTPPQGGENPSPRRRLLYFLIFGMVIALIAGGGFFLLYNDVTNRYKGERHDAVPVAAGVTLTAYLHFEEANVFPIGITAASNGDLYLSLFGRSAVKRVSDSGQMTTAVPLTAPGAITLAPDGTLYVIDYSAPDFRALGTLKRITPDGMVRFHAETINQVGLPLFADLALDEVGNLYVSDPDKGVIWRVTPEGAALVWWTIPLLGTTKAQPIGLAYEPSRKSLLIADAGTGTLYRAALTDSVPVGEPLYRAAGVNLRTVAVDSAGRIYLSLWQGDNGVVRRLEPDGTLTTIAEKFRAPLGMLAKGSVLYVVNSDITGLIDQIGDKPPFTVDRLDLSVLP